MAPPSLSTTPKRSALRSSSTLTIRSFWLAGSSSDPGTSNKSFADFWGKVAAHFKGDSNVLFNLMNEPHSQQASQRIVLRRNAVIDAIRDSGAKETRARHLLDWSSFLGVVGQ